ncbi:FAD-dependent oxidoreductase [Splendidivirga corallicola]
MTNTSKGESVIVAGAGAFGGWTALMLLRKGFKVTLVDPWGPGNNRSSSGGETRFIRYVYGGQHIYTTLSLRAKELWIDLERDIDKQLLIPKEVLWLSQTKQNTYLDEAIPAFDKYKIGYEKLTPKEAQIRFPNLNTEDLEFLLIEKDAGILKAREACQSVVKVFLKEGGIYLQQEARPLKNNTGKVAGLQLANGDTLTAGHYIFACGPWLKKLFPEVLADVLEITRQEVFFFGTPPGYADYFEHEMLPWLDVEGTSMYYGFPGYDYRGFKMAHHHPGATFDPTDDERIVTSEELQKARTYLEHRFPIMKGAPLVESRVCQYSSTKEDHFILDRHPEMDNLWLLGGGSGHGFKHGPAIGELMANVLAQTAHIPEAFLLNKI